jgi:hypothetical protein
MKRTIPPTIKTTLINITKIFIRHNNLTIIRLLVPADFSSAFLSVCLKTSGAEVLDDEALEAARED